MSHEAACARVSGRATVVSNNLSVEKGTAFATIVLNLHEEGTKRTIECDFQERLLLSFFLPVGAQVALAYDIFEDGHALLRYMWRATPQISRLDETAQAHQVSVRINCGSFLE